jgi:hypothetical protein
MSAIQPGTRVVHVLDRASCAHHGVCITKRFLCQMLHKGRLASALAAHEHHHRYAKVRQPKLFLERAEASVELHTQMQTCAIAD